MRGANQLRSGVRAVLALAILGLAAVLARGAEDAEYLRWLQEHSMLAQAEKTVAALKDQGQWWRQPYAEPRPEKVVEEASAWILIYPGSVIARPGQSVLAAWAEPELWDTLHEVGIDLLHTGPIQRAGGLHGRQYTPSVDGGFDPISLAIDPELGTEEEYRRLIQVAGAHGAGIAGDLVPLHTGKGADFLLALRAYQEYPSMYVLSEIKKEDWALLPEVSSPWDSAPLPLSSAKALEQRGYLPGIIHSNDASNAALQLTGWDATGAVEGADGQTRRWVYLHFFKPGQPTLNWLHPAAAAQRAVDGSLAELIGLFDARGVRLDAVPFLGIEPIPERLMTWHYQHPLAILSTEHLAMLARKLGGWTYQELNVPLQRLKAFVKDGPDLSYDFFTRTELVHALLIGDATLLRQALRFLQEEQVEPGWLVHDMQNHDEITYQLVELEARSDEVLHIDGEEVTGRQLRERTLQEMRTKATGPTALYNRLYRPQQDGVATTFAGFVAASLKITDPYHATAAQVQQIKRGHLLLAFANAMQPGVFSLSSWDLVGALPLPTEAVAERLEDQDYRWLNRGAVDLLGHDPQATRSAWGLPPAQSLYGSLPEQLRDPDSFASGVKRILDARRRYQIPLAKLAGVPEVKHRELCVLLLTLPGQDAYAITALNFGRNSVEEVLDLAPLVPCNGRPVAGRKLVDALSGSVEGTIDANQCVQIGLPPLTGKTLVLAP